MDMQLKYLSILIRRSLIAFPGAAERYSKDHFTSPEIQDVVQRAKYIYATSFFLESSFETLLELSNHLKKNQDKVRYIIHHFIISLSPPIYLYLDIDYRYR